MKRTTRLHITKRKDIRFESFTAQKMWEIELTKRAWKAHCLTPEYQEKKKLEEIEDRKRIEERKKKEESTTSNKDAICYVLSAWFDNDDDDK